MKAKYVAVLFGVGLLFASGTASAQFGGLPGKLPSGLGGGGDSAVSADGIVSKYVAGARNVNSADIKMLRAVGLKAEADRAELQAKNLTEGATKDALEDAAKSQTESSKALEDALKDNKTKMDAKSKEQFSSGMGDLAKGILAYIGLSKDVSGFRPSVGNLGGSAMSAAYVVKTLPESVKSLVSTLKSSIAFAKANNIPVPKEASDATSAI